jgi:hypothetical protein
MKPKTIELHIEKLVLDGFAADGAGVAAAVERELAQLLADRLPAHFQSTGTHTAMQGGSFEIGGRPSANSIGSAVASAIHGAKKP